MFQEINGCAQILSDKFVRAAVTGDVINVKEYFSAYTCDVIARTAFGLDVNSQSYGEAEPFSRHLEVLTSPPPRYFGRIPFILAAIFPWFRDVLYFLGVSAVPKETYDYFSTTSHAIIEDRKKHPADHADFIQLLLDAKYDGTLVTEEDGYRNTLTDKSKYSGSNL